MFQLLRDPNFDFMRKRTVALSVSAVVVLLASVVIGVVGINPGVEFAGGTELQIRYADQPDLATIRSDLAAAGMTSASVTTIGDPADHEVYVRLGTSAVEDEEQDPTSRLLRVLRGGESAAADLNVIDRNALAGILAGAPGMTRSSADELAEAVLTERKDRAIFHAIDDLAGVPGMTPELLAYLGQNTTLGHLALRSQSYIGPAIGNELQQKAALAILGSLVGMLVYIWIRFQFQWGFAAVVALAHDTVIVLGLFVLFGKEMSLPVVAAFLTLVGYSVNDTVVVFDRIRENLSKMAGEPLARVINLSINQTLSRTVITSALTLGVVVPLLLFGGNALNPFAFVLTVGVVVGTYSSIFIASPILVLWKQYVDKRRATQGRNGAAPKPGRARKVRAG